MTKIYQFEDLQFQREVMNSYNTYLGDCSKEDREYVEKFITRIVLPIVKRKMKEKGINKDSVEFYDLLFDEVCNQLIMTSSYTSGTTKEFKSELKAMLYEKRENDKDSLLYDYQLDARPEVSDYEFDVLRMIDDIVSFVNKRIGNTISKR